MGIYCRKHKRASRRHGHPEQTAITSAELKDARKLVSRRLRAHADRPTKNLLEQQWRALGSIAREHEAECREGSPYFRHRRTAFLDIVRVTETTTPIEGASEVMAVLIRSMEAPRRFKGHNALLTQLARRFYRLTDHHAGTYFDHETQKIKRVYRDITPRVLLTVGEALLDAFGGAAGAFFRMDEGENQSRQALKEKLRALA